MSRPAYRPIVDEVARHAGTILESLRYSEDKIRNHDYGRALDDIAAQIRRENMERFAAAKAAVEACLRKNINPNTTDE